MPNPKHGEGKKALNIMIPISDHVMLKKVAAENCISIARLISQYAKYLKMQRAHVRRPLYGKGSTKLFNVTPGNTDSICEHDIIEEEQNDL